MAYALSCSSNCPATHTTNANNIDTTTIVVIVVVLFTFEGGCSGIGVDR